MRHDVPGIITVVSILLTPLLGVAAADSDGPDRERIHESYVLENGASVEVLGTPGPVEIETTSDDVADINVVRTSPTHADLECGKVVIEHTPKHLRITTEDLCPIVHGQQHVMLKLPRWVDLSLRSIAGDVRIGPTDGIVRLESIAGQAIVTDMRLGTLSSLARGLSLTIGDVDPRGIRVSSVVGGVELMVRKGVNADLIVRSLDGHVRSDVSDVIRVGNRDSDYETVIGSGGSKILLESIVGGVDIRRGR